MKQQKENPLLNILFNIALPTLILIKLSKESALGPVYGLVLALLFPLGYGVYDLIKTRKVNFISILGLVSVLLTGVFGLLKLPPSYIAWKEAAVPLIIGIAIPLSMKTKFHLFEKLIYNNTVWDKDKIDAKLVENGYEDEMTSIITKATYLFSISFFVSSVLNYVLAKVILVSPPGSEAYNAELGKMTSLSFPVIAVPSMIVMFGVMFYFVKGIQRLTGYKFEEVLNNFGDK